jgi:hypothetical protein
MNSIDTVAPITARAALSTTVHVTNTMQQFLLHRKRKGLRYDL